MDMRGIGNFAFDILPQTAGVAFFSAMVTGLKLRKHPALIGAALSLSSTCRLVLLLVGLSVIMFGGIGFGLLHFSGFPSIGFWTGLLFKIAWGGIVSMIAVLFVIKWMITKVQSQ